VHSGIPRSQPINMKQSNRRSSNCNMDINSISPPSVQFAIGTPPSRRRSTSGGETPPIPPSTWQISPSATTNFHHQSPSTLRRSGTTGGIGCALAKLPTLSSPTLLSENNNPLVGTRAFTLPDMTGAGANGFSLLHNDSKNALDDQPITFYAPELPAETLLDVSHSTTSKKFPF
jgi:serine/threonine-protein kinase ULK2